MRDPFYDRDHDAILSAAETKRERRRLRNIRNEERQAAAFHADRVIL